MFMCMCMCSLILAMGILFSCSHFPILSFMLSLAFKPTFPAVP